MPRGRGSRMLWVVEYLPRTLWRTTKWAALTRLEAREIMYELKRLTPSLRFRLMRYRPMTRPARGEGRQR